MWNNSNSVIYRASQVEAPKKKVKKSNIPVSEVVYGAMLPADVQQAVEKEFEMALQGRLLPADVQQPTRTG